MNNVCKPFLLLEILVGFAPTVFFLLIDSFLAMWGVFAVGALGEDFNIHAGFEYFVILAQWLGLWGVLYVAALVWHGVTSFTIPRSIRVFLVFGLFSLGYRNFPFFESLVIDGVYHSPITWIVLLPAAVSIHILFLGRAYLMRNNALSDA
ncbi:hypothetical protein [Microbulbifer pacificus]|uniref:Uncharacterized protein n=1 Tax=Microbulbifer pacificus TaxID=407164 RepID=A0AAU0MUZ4_9GAMM|nr:hypothetical protein [Microbulbifer pacificus]WOX04416.1 hypothetical protein R5R33_11760 [Microbulbifer pacificus]